MPNNNERVVIDVRGVTKRYFDTNGVMTTYALSPTSFSLHQSEFIVLLGPSGCGKTTLLNMVAGFESVTDGRILQEGKAIAGASPDRGVIFQSPNLFPWLNVEDNVLFGPSIQKRRNTKETQALTATLLQMVGLEQFRKHHPYELSGGMQQRVAYARVLVNQPKVVLADEPFGALDEHTRRRLQGDFEDIFLKSQTAVIMVTHSIEEAIYLADRILVMSARPGQIKSEITVNLKRPRDRTELDFLKIQAQLLELLGSEVVDNPE
jgi:NitT/TauT family transport system ATP-binding protein